MSQTQVEFVRSISEAAVDVYIARGGKFAPFIAVSTDDEDDENIAPIGDALGMIDILGKHIPFFLLGMSARERFGSGIRSVMVGIEASFMSAKRSEDDRDQNEIIDEMLGEYVSLHEHPKAKDGIVFACLSTTDRVPHIIIYEVVSGNDLIKFFDSTETDVAGTSEAHFEFLSAFLDGYETK